MRTGSNWPKLRVNWWVLEEKVYYRSWSLYWKTNEFMVELNSVYTQNNNILLDVTPCSRVKVNQTIWRNTFTCTPPSCGLLACLPLRPWRWGKYVPFTNTTNTTSHRRRYEGESLNVSQMDIERKTCDIRTSTKYLVLDMSSTDSDTLVSMLYQCVETLSLRFKLFVISDTFETQLWTDLRDKHFPP
jgi:hypothetical protein